MKSFHGVLAGDVHTCLLKSSIGKARKVYRDIWPLDLPDGYRLEYTVVDADHVVLVLFIGNHDDAAAYLRGKK
jgi:mRNA-degrading endonuclease RelE of RelBE toxin-antitoxin system